MSVFADHGEVAANPAGFVYRRDFIAPREADRLLERLWSTLPWRQQNIFLFGRQVPQPRLTAWIGDPQTSYRYSGLSLEPAPWTTDLDGLRTRLSRALGQPFNSVLANAYRDGRDSMGWHADDEPELGMEPVIASVSLGATRRFRLRHVVRGRASGETTGFDLRHGSLLVMSGTSQADYRHAVPKTARPTGLRINLTFRYVLPQA